MRKTTTNECSQFIKRTDRKVFFRAPVIFSRKRGKQIFLPTNLPFLSPHFWSWNAKVWKDHSRSIRVIPCTLPRIPPGLLKKTTTGGHRGVGPFFLLRNERGEGNEGNDRLAATLNIIMNIPFKWLDRSRFQIRGTWWKSIEEAIGQFGVFSVYLTWLVWFLNFFFVIHIQFQFQLQRKSSAILPELVEKVCRWSRCPWSVNWSISWYRSARHDFDIVLSGRSALLANIVTRFPSTSEPLWKRNQWHIETPSSG